MQSAKRLLEMIMEAQGPIVLPLSHETIETAKRLATKRDEIAAMTLKHLHLSEVYLLAAYAASHGKEIQPLYTKEHGRIARRFLSVNFENLPESVDATAYMHDRAFQAEAHQMLHHFERFRTNPPALIFAEDTHAIILGRLLRKKIHWLTKPSTVFGKRRRFSNITLGKIMEIMRGKPRRR